MTTNASPSELAGRAADLLDEWARLLDTSDTDIAAIRESITSISRGLAAISQGMNEIPNALDRNADTGSLTHTADEENGEGNTRELDAALTHIKAQLRGTSRISGEASRDLNLATVFLVPIQQSE